MQQWAIEKKFQEATENFFQVRQLAEKSLEVAEESRAIAEKSLEIANETRHIVSTLQE